MARGGSVVKFTAVAEDLVHVEFGFAQAPGKRRRLAFRMVVAGRRQIFYPEVSFGDRVWWQREINEYLTVVAERTLKGEGE